MKLTKTFQKNLNAYKDGYRIIANKGSSRSSKTYSILQLFYLLCKHSKIKKVIHVVSYALPHLVDGAISDFDNIIENDGADLSKIKTKNPYTYKIGKSVVKFIGMDKPGRALGAARDILFINEANNLKWEVVHQLMFRTTEKIFIDYNPSIKFWITEKGLNKRKGFISIHSTFLDNLENLSEAQISDFMEMKKNHDEEKEKGIEGFWFNQWRVYGLGLEGRLEGTIINNWQTGEFPEHLDCIYGIDWGFKDPMTCTRVAIEANTLYAEEIVYKSGLSPDNIVDILSEKVPKGALLVADNADPTMIIHLKKAGFNIMPCLSKDKVSVGVRHLSKYKIIPTKESENIINELNSYVWLDKKGEVPIDNFNHSIDGIRYVEKLIRLKRG